MPSYSYYCEHCKKHFELFSTIKDYVEKPKCCYCSSNSTIRNFMCDVLTQSSSVKKSDSELKTIGDLALRNTERMSDDQKINLYTKHNSYKESKTETKPLPKGMKYVDKPKFKYKWTQ